MTIKENVINSLLEKGFLLSQDFIENIPENFNVGGFLNRLNELKEKPTIIDKNYLGLLKEHEILDTVALETQKSEKPKIEDTDFPVKIIKEYPEEPKKRDVKDFISYFKARYNTLKKILITRHELQDAVSINRLYNKREKEEVAIIGIVANKVTTKNKNVILILEDLTGSINVLISKNKHEIHDLTKEIVLDEVIGITGVMGDRIVFVNNVYFPEIPNKELKKCKDEVYTIFISDLHVGLRTFFEENFIKFLKWLNLEIGDEKQKEIARKVKYLFIVGDLVEGVGVYPGQEKDLVIKDIYDQYKKFAELLSLVPKEIKVVLCGGNHDALRIAEPQPALYTDIAKPVYELPNVIITTNPAVVNIHARNNFPGFDVLLYHGYSFAYYANELEMFRLAGGVKKVDAIMKFLLQKRHLAPAHTSTLYVPSINEDPLVIDIVPDFFVSGHIHKAVVSNYKSITMISASCWVGLTDYQERRGIIPEPCKVILSNLKTRETKILDFSE